MAMHPDPARRYATVNALIQDLERYRAHEPVTARPDTVGYRVNRFLRRHAVGVALTGLAVASLVLGGSRRPRRRARRPATRESRCRVRAGTINLSLG
jgi:serine/threonine-protein kinase